MNTPLRLHILTLVFLSLILSSCVQPPDEAVTSPVDICAGAGFASGTEVSECTSTMSVGSSPSVVSGTATFFKRTVVVNQNLGQITSLILGAPIAAALPIKYAEVRVLNASNTVVQCGTTDANGSLKATDGVSNLQIPGSAGTYKVQVMARSNHNVSVAVGKPAFKLYASVKSPCNNEVHSISSNIVTSGPNTYSTSMTAYARESESAEVSGGAFNIYNNITTVYDYLGQNTAVNSDLSCLSPKLSVFWSAGFNPGQLVYPDGDPSDSSEVPNISFYLRGYNELYINGGRLGNVASEDTDQFDDAVIIHELGHRVEDACGKMDSPGGTHYGQYRIDPRLAWSEGWGNFFGAHIIRNNLSLINPELITTMAAYDSWLYYLDTAGYTDGATNSGNQLIRLNLSRPGKITPFTPLNPNTRECSDRSTAPGPGSSTTCYDYVDSAAYPGEGHFREVSVSRSLFKNTNSCTTNANCVNTNYFPQIWKAFEKDPAGIGMGKSIYPFRSSVRFYDRLKNVFGGSFPAAVSGTTNTISNTVNVDEAQQLAGDSAYTAGVSATWVPYAIKLVNNGSTPCPLAIQPRQEDFTSPIVRGGFIVNYEIDQRYSSHFYYLDRSTAPMSSVTSISLNLAKNSGTNVDIDLVLYQDGFSFPQENCTSVNSCTKNTTSTQFIRADRSIANAPASPYSKTITSLNFLSNSTPQMLNVRAYTSGKTISNTTSYSYTLTDQSGNFLCPSSSF